MSSWLTERGQPAHKFRVGGGQSITDELHERFGVQVTGRKRTVNTPLHVAQVDKIEGKMQAGNRVWLNLTTHVSVTT